MIDVGQGEAVLVQFPSGHNLLVDAGGGAGTFDVGGRVVAPALWASGVRRLDWLVLTHGDLDHSGGARRVMQDLRPREVWEGVPVPTHAALHVLRAEAQARGVVWRRVLDGHNLEVGAATVEVLHPPRPDWERRRVRNDDSVVVRVRFGAMDLLLTGDAAAEFEAQSDRLTDGRGAVRVLKVGHHGSRTSTSDRLLSAYAPHVALISAGANNLFGHPAPDVVARLEAHRADVFRTDRDGATVIETDGRVVNVRSWTGRESTVVVRF